MYIIVGLGNPGKQYIDTRHNIGFDAVDVLASKFNIKIKKVKHKAVTGEGIIANEKVLLVKPQTYMNLSGESVRELKEWHKTDNDKIIVIYDDVSLPVGKIRIRGKGSDGGHNGIKNIIYQLQSDAFPRIKIGVGAPEHEDYELKDYVLGRFNKDEIKTMIEVVKTVTDAVEEIITRGTDSAMNKFN